MLVLNQPHVQAFNCILALIQGILLHAFKIENIPT